MKKAVFCILVILVAMRAVGFSQNNKMKVNIKADTAAADSAEYRLIVLDPGFETWLANKPSKNFYSNDFYRMKNRFFVSEWNLRYMTANGSGVYDNYIDFNPDTDYGIDINYRLYYYFLYFEETNHVNLYPASR
jgi:hypothetical protein